MIEQDYINNTKAKNKELFAAKEIKITPESLERLMRHAFRAGKQSISNKTDDLYNQFFDSLLGAKR